MVKSIDLKHMCYNRSKVCGPNIQRDRAEELLRLFRMKRGQRKYAFVIQMEIIMLFWKYLIEEIVEGQERVTLCKDDKFKMEIFIEQKYHHKYKEYINFRTLLPEYVIFLRLNKETLQKLDGYYKLTMCGNIRKRIVELTKFGFKWNQYGQYKIHKSREYNGKAKPSPQKQGFTPGQYSPMVS